MNKTYIRINWENRPSEKTPVNEQNLNRMDGALDEIDNRVIALDKAKANLTDISMLFSDVFMDEQTGIITFTRNNGSTLMIDTPLEKIALNIYYDPVTEKLIVPLIDGTNWEVDLSRLITEHEFVDSETVAFVISTDGKVTAKIKDGSIEERHLRPDYLSDITVEAEKALKGAEDSEKSKTLAESYVHGGTGIREDEDSDNAMEYARKAKESADKASEIAGGGFIPQSEKGTSGGVATLDSTGKVPESQLPENIGLVTGVKGNAETTYRTGNVNITPENIGALKFDANAVSSSKWKNTRNINGMHIDGTSDRANYGVCSTAAATAAKTVACTGFALSNGAEITVKFSVTNTAANPTLNVNNTGEKPVFYHGTAISAEYLAENRTYTFKYNGIQWDFVGDVNTDTRYGNMVAATATAAGKAGLVPAPEAGSQEKFLRGDGTWQEAGGEVNIMQGASDSASGVEGLVPSPGKGTQDDYLTGAGTWQNADNHAVKFTSGDVNDIEATEWTSVEKLTSEETQKSIFSKISNMFKNVRYLWKLMGDTDISAIGDGTVTGAIKKLNTGMGYEILEITQDNVSEGVELQNQYCIKMGSLITVSATIHVTQTITKLKPVIRLLPVGKVDFSGCASFLSYSTAYVYNGYVNKGSIYFSDAQEFSVGLYGLFACYTI